MKGFFESNPNLIELTRTYNGVPVNTIFINPDKIVWIEKKDTVTYIRVQGSERDGICVVESPEDIIKAYFKD